jgi:hypothetical protein
MVIFDLDEFDLEGKAIADYGLDGMIGAELRNWIFKEFATDIPFQKLLGSSFTITKLSALVCANHGIVIKSFGYIILPMKQNAGMYSYLSSEGSFRPDDNDRHFLSLIPRMRTRPAV